MKYVPGIILTILVFCCLTDNLSGQSTIKIEGYVSAHNGEPLEGANVNVVGTGYGAATDASGYFAIENLFAGEYRLQANFLGFRPESRDIVVQKDLTTTVSFKLEPEAIVLKEVTVEAKRDRQEISHFQEIITAEEIQQHSGRTLGELLINVPGIDVWDEGGGSGQKRISIRGSQSNQVLILYDGVPLNDPFAGHVDLNQISLASVDEIRIWKGGNSSQFGNGALGGVIEIISKNHALDEVRMSGHYGDFDAFGIQPGASGTFGKFDYFLSFENLHADGDYPYSYRRLDGAVVNEDRLNADFTSKNYFGKLIFEHKAHAVQLQANFYNSSRGLPGLVLSWTPYARAKSNRRILIGKYVFKQNNLQTRLQISQHLNESEYKNDPPADAPLRFRGVPPYHTEYSILSNRGALELEYKLAGQHSLDINTAIQRDSFDDRDLVTRSFGAIRETDNLNYSLVIHHIWQLPTPEFLTKAVLSPSMRFDFMSYRNSDIARKDLEISPRIGLLISRSQSWRINFKSNWGRSFRAPTFADLFFQDFRVRGNPNLLPEKSYDFDAGIELGIPWLGWLEFSATYFRHNVENFIIWELGSFATYQPVNSDALLQGWEFGGSWKILNDKIHLNLDHVFLNGLNKSGQRTTHNKKLINRPEYTTKLAVRLDLNKVALDYHKRWVGKRYVTASNTVSVPSYTVDDLTMRYKQDLGKLQLNFKFSLFNLFNAKYEIIEHAPMPGRNWRAGLELVY